MGKEKYSVVSKFNCCGKSMVTVIIDGRAACVMPDVNTDELVHTARSSSACFPVF